KALVFGGTGLVGGAVLHHLAKAAVPIAFSWHTQREKAQALAAELKARPLQIDLEDGAAIRWALKALRDEGFTPNVFIHCAGVNGPKPLAEVADADWRRALEVNCHSALIAVQELAPHLNGQGDIVLVGALDRTQTAAMAAHFAASQGALTAVAMA